MVGTTLTIERELGLKVETLEEPWYVSSPLGIRARIGYADVASRRSRGLYSQWT